MLKLKVKGDTLHSSCRTDVAFTVLNICKIAMVRNEIFCGIFNPTTTNYVAIFYNSTMYLKFVNFKMVVLSNNSYESFL